MAFYGNLSRSLIVECGQRRTNGQTWWN